MQGDPSAVPYAVQQVQELLGQKPIFGICMGHQLLGQAFGGKTFKLKFGHHGGNHPVRHNSSGPSAAVTDDNNNSNNNNINSNKDNDSNNAYNNNNTCHMMHFVLLCQVQRRRLFLASCS